jgi:putative FmdB family regulatory protein
MPLYEYTCENCQHAFEALVFDGEQVECPQCRGHRLQRQWSVPARPRVQGESLPMSCDPSLPPCGPGCCRLPSE